KLLDSHPLVVSEAVQGLHELDSQQSFAACDDAVQKCLQKGGEFAVHICRAIGACTLTAFGDAVVALLDDTKPAVRTAAVHCLGQLGKVDAIPKILEKYPLADFEFQKEAMQAMQAMGDQAAAPLTPYLKNKHPFIWSAVIRSLSGLMSEDEMRAVLIPS